ncbi:MAG: hypothetical protein JNL25_04085 [Rhodospirillaceae bacterium]|nr:hypothetical protein [Rhodospirillaceae bacterium]
MTYRGPLASNGNAEKKAAIRSAFDVQLAELWKQEPLCQISKYLDPTYQPNDCYLGVRRGSTTYYPVISSKIFTLVELDVLMLRPGDPGAVVRHGGDIDNRIKTLLDALTVPTSDHPRGDARDRMFCLLEDDKLITRLSVETDRLLEPDAHQNHVVLVIHANVTASSGRMCNIAIT